MSEVSVAFTSFVADLVPYVVAVLGLALTIYGIVLLFKFGTKWFTKTASK